MIQLNPGIVRFSGKIINAGGGGAYVNFPHNVEEMFGMKGRVPVNVIFEKKVKYRGSLAKMGTEFHVLIVLKSIREQLGKDFGDEINVELELDTVKRKVSIPSYLKKVLEANQTTKEKFEKLAYSHQKEFVTWINGAKKKETRDLRVQKFLEMMSNK
ncbi:MAG TPA: YdeI/OmpD-associated family protein [Candidatus Dojkabacteria bacterium]|nr:YdeI/OmpD-associated family protein [Candidatus Dojkabacteria bacterium]